MGYEFEGKIVVVTGALGALGSELALQFAEQGAIVVAGYRGEQHRFDSLVERFREQPREGELHGCCFDVTKSEQVDEAIDGVLKRFGRVDVLINNAGCNVSAPFMSLEERLWDMIVDTNLTGTKNMCAAVSRPMMARRSGAIVNISSVSGTTLGRGSAAYAASKAAINRLTQVAAVELGKKGVRVNAVSPGLLETGMGETIHPLAEKVAIERTPLGRKGTVQEVSEAVLFLASSKASFITGHVLNVDGGLSHG